MNARVFVTMIRASVLVSATLISASAFATGQCPGDDEDLGGAPVWGGRLHVCLKKTQVDGCRSLLTQFPQAGAPAYSACMREQCMASAAPRMHGVYEKCSGELKTFLENSTIDPNRRSTIMICVAMTGLSVYLQNP